MTQVFNIFPALAPQGGDGAAATGGKLAGGLFESLLVGAGSLDRAAGAGAAPGQPAPAFPLDAGSGFGDAPPGPFAAYGLALAQPANELAGSTDPSTPEFQPSAPPSQGLAVALQGLARGAGESGEGKAGLALFTPERGAIAAPAAGTAPDGGSPAPLLIDELPADGDALQRLLVATPRPAPGDNTSSLPGLPGQASDAARTALNEAAARLAQHTAQQGGPSAGEAKTPAANADSSPRVIETPAQALVFARAEGERPGNGENRTSSALFLSPRSDGAPAVGSDDAAATRPAPTPGGHPAAQGGTARTAAAGAEQNGTPPQSAGLRPSPGPDLPIAGEPRGNAALPREASQSAAASGAHDRALPGGFDSALAALPSESGAAAHAYAKGAATAGARSAPPPPPEQIAIRIASAIQEGLDRITIQLKPASLGRIDIELNLHHGGRVHAVVTADRPDTLELLQRDARDLARALQDAGLKTDSNSLNFSLRGGEGERQWEFGGEQRIAVALPAPAGEADGATDLALLAAAGLGRNGSAYGIDIRV